uniref:E3 ubiquitin-protein ligase RNF123 n=1 Tax=Pristiophorus japonicus TaxID=55135 RepID=UPI00398EA455
MWKMTSKGSSSSYSRKSYRLTSDTEKPKVTGFVNDKLLSNYLYHAFPSSENTQLAATSRKPLNFQNLNEHLDRLLSEGLNSEADDKDQSMDGRLGPTTVVLDHTSGFEGLLLVDDDLLGVVGHSNFSSIRATSCVYKGKWMYEVLISSQGLMQIGWCTLHCRFNQEEGVGDTSDSYAYDGNRVRKWNVTTTNYGKAWAAGDIVTCVIDLDEGKIGFCLNGISLGIAFQDIKLGPGMAYFPAISLSFKESVAFNFGSRPIRYPVEGYRPMQNPPEADLLKAHKLLGYLKNVITTGMDTQEEKLTERDSALWQAQGEPTVLITLAHIFNRFAPLMCKVYLVEEVLMTYFLGILEGGGAVDEHPLIQNLLDLMWLLMEDYEVQECLKQLMMSLLRAYRFSPIIPDLGLQIHYLRLTIAILKHEKTRKYLLSNVLYPFKPTYDLASKANIIIDPAEISAISMDDLDEDDESVTQQLRPGSAASGGGALARPSWLSSPTLGRANRFLSTAAVSLMNPRRSLATVEKVKIRTLSVEQRTEEDIEGSHGNDGLLLGRPPNEPDLPITENSLLEILDGAIMMYNLSVHQQLGKMVGVSDDVHEYAVALKDTEDKIARCPATRKDILDELTKSQKVFSEKLNHLSRRLAWINATIYSKEKMLDIYWLLQVCVRVIEHSDRTKTLFAFMPEFYMNVAMNSYSALKNYFSPVNSMDELLGYQETLSRLAAILAKHFADSRIVGTDIKDSLMQALASYVCYPHSLRAVERIPEEQRVAMMKNLLAPYEQRPWAQTNWILVRLWRGCGFGYRYTRLPHLLKSKPEDANMPSLQKPCPSTLLQQHMADLLRSDCEMAASFLNSVLNQLNWAFSEFIGMIQEIQQAAERPERNFVDSRQLKVCATCFDLSVSLLRVLEMTVTLVPEIFLNWSRPSAELLLRRLAQLINQVLNRVTAEKNLFDRVVNLRLPGLESVDHYPILVAVTGVLVRILVDSDFQGVQRATTVLLADPCFQLRSIQYLLGENEVSAVGTTPPPTEKKHFSLQAYPDYISMEELGKVESLLSHLTRESKQAAATALPTSEEDLCPICYAHPISAIFRPCSHKSCKACINQHLMNNKDCFFCKATITAVDDYTKPSTSSS